jgi:serine kinase of HPr protein (carbohydrate metabolism regulator)
LDSRFVDNEINIFEKEEERYLGRRKEEEQNTQISSVIRKKPIVICVLKKFQI